ncbi:uncharacterized protein [Takifugu rubripes]|uniref:uncharacterized protein n=1 Tax=Takifugu rubripes TaxID=31033 RepID=UPI0005D22F8B|nr:uncharacterized protein LOC101075832 [Takifugu rubripes]|eukprot:XP_003970429.2 PREDICTED: uncharacterized protein LOC101075832 [Takifugu rubripes]
MLLFVLVALYCVGFSAGVRDEEQCYGNYLPIPFSYHPPLYKGPIYFTPKGERRSSRRTIANNGQSNHPRFKITSYSATLKDLRETDEGTYSVSFGDNDITDIINLKVLECGAEVTKTYGNSFYIDVPREAQYLEFTRLNSKETTVLWNRTGSLINKENLKINRNQIHVHSLTQLDNGYYNIRKKDNTLMSRKKLQVEAKETHLEATDRENVFIRFPSKSKTWTLTYISDEDDEEHTLVDKGIQVRDSYIHVPFKRRFSKYDDGINISPVESGHSGTYYFKDPDGNLAETVRLEVFGYLPTYVYILVPILIILALIGCCCCVRKCCCKKSSSKGNESAPAAQQQDRAQPSVTYSVAPATPVYSYQPVRPVAPSQPAAFSTGPSMAAPPQPAASPAGFQVQPNFLSSDGEPTFELKGSNFSSAPLFSSNSTMADVYTSDKLNFL